MTGGRDPQVGTFRYGPRDRRFAVVVEAIGDSHNRSTLLRSAEIRAEFED